jgi:hypothetical protein
MPPPARQTRRAVAANQPRGARSLIFVTLVDLTDGLAAHWRQQSARYRSRCVTPSASRVVGDRPVRRSSVDLRDPRRSPAGLLYRSSWRSSLGDWSDGGDRTGGRSERTQPPAPTTSGPGLSISTSGCSPSISSMRPRPTRCCSAWDVRVEPRWDGDLGARTIAKLTYRWTIGPCAQRRQAADDPEQLLRGQLVDLTRGLCGNISYDYLPSPLTCDLIGSTRNHAGSAFAWIARRRSCWVG